MPVRSARRRYIWINIETDSRLDSDFLDKLIEAKILYLYGIKGVIEMNYRLIGFSSDENHAIVRCNHNKLNELRTALAHISVIAQKPARIDVKRVSGTLKSLKKDCAHALSK